MYVNVPSIYVAVFCQSDINPGYLEHHDNVITLCNPIKCWWHDLKCRSAFNNIGLSCILNIYIFNAEVAANKKKSLWVTLGRPVSDVCLLCVCVCVFSCSSPACSLVWLFWLSCCWLDHCSTSYLRCVYTCVSIQAWGGGETEREKVHSPYSFTSLLRQYWHASTSPASDRCSCSSRTYLSYGESARLTL